jgi:hypothetical protein
MSYLYNSPKDQSRCQVHILRQGAKSKIRTHSQALDFKTRTSEQNSQIYFLINSLKNYWTNFLKNFPPNFSPNSSKWESEKNSKTLLMSFLFLLATLSAACISSRFMGVYAGNIGGDNSIQGLGILDESHNQNSYTQNRLQITLNPNQYIFSDNEPDSSNKDSNSTQNHSETYKASPSHDRSNLARELAKVKHIDNQTKGRILISIRKASKETGIPEELILVLIKKESSFKAKAISSQGARGLTQLMPHTARAYCGLSGEQIMEIENNISCGSLYLRKLLKEFDGDIRLSLAAYNTGPAFIKRYRSGHGNHKKGFEDCRHILNRNVVHYAESINLDYSRIIQS